MNNFINRKYLILNVNELSKVEFDKILENSVQSLRFSVNEQKTFIKWDGENPDFILNLNTKEGPYTYDEIKIILDSYEWCE